MPSRAPAGTFRLVGLLTANTRAIFACAAVLMVAALVAALARSRLEAARRPLLSLPARVRLRLYPGPGFTRSRWSLWRIHGLPAARASARRTRPSLSWWARHAGPWTEYATFIGWAAHRWIAPVRIYAGFEQLQLLIAPPQRGKSAAAAGRILDDPGPVVVTSIRGDLIAATAGLRQRRGEVHVFNPEGVGAYASTFSWAPTDGCQDMATAVRRAGYQIEAMTSKGLEDSTFWSDQASMVLGAFLHAAGLAAGSMADVYRWVLDDDAGQPLRILSRHPAAAPAAARHLRQYLSLPDRTRAGITATLVGVLRYMQVPQIAAMVCPPPGNGFDFQAFLRSQDILFLVASDAAQSPVPPLFAALVAEITHQARLAGGTHPASPARPPWPGLAQFWRARFWLGLAWLGWHHLRRPWRGQPAPGRSRNGRRPAPPSRLDPPLTLELDEVANIAPVPVAAWATWAAGSGIRMHIYAQSFAQLAQRWGQLGAETLWQACDIKIVYATCTEEALCRKVEDACGHVRLRGPAPAGPARRAQAGLEPVMPFAAIRQLPPGRAVVLRGGAPPVIVRTERYWGRGDVTRFARRGGRPVLPPPRPGPSVRPIPSLLASAAYRPGQAELPAGPAVDEGLQGTPVTRR